MHELVKTTGLHGNLAIQEDMFPGKYVEAIWLVSDKMKII